MQPVPITVPEGQRVRVTPEQASKLRNELEIVGNNCTMLHDMLSALDPEENVQDADVIQDLHLACTRMQSRLIDLISQLQNEDLLGYVRVRACE